MELVIHGPSGYNLKHWLLCHKKNKIHALICTLICTPEGRCHSTLSRLFLSILRCFNLVSSSRAACCVCDISWRAVISPLFSLFSLLQIKSVYLSYAHITAVNDAMKRGFRAFHCSTRSLVALVCVLSYCVFLSQWNTGKYRDRDTRIMSNNDVQSVVCNNNN